MIIATDYHPAGKKLAGFFYLGLIRSVYKLNPGLHCPYGGVPTVPISGIWDYF